MTKHITLSLLALLTAIPSASYTNDTPLWVKVGAGVGILALTALNVNLSKKNAQLKRDLQTAKDQGLKAQVQRMELGALLAGALERNDENMHKTADRLNQTTKDYTSIAARQTNGCLEVLDNLIEVLACLKTQGGVTGRDGKRDDRKTKFILNDLVPYLKKS